MFRLGTWYEYFTVQWQELNIQYRGKIGCSLQRHECMATNRNDGMESKSFHEDWIVKVVNNVAVTVWSWSVWLLAADDDGGLMDGYSCKRVPRDGSATLAMRVVPTVRPSSDRGCLSAVVERMTNYHRVFATRSAFCLPLSFSKCSGA